MSTCSPIWKLSELYPFVCLWRLYYISIIDEIVGHWQLTQPLISPPLPRSYGAGTESSSPIITWVALLPASSHRLVWSINHFINRKYISHSYHLRHSEDFRSPVPKTGTKTKYVLYYKSQFHNCKRLPTDNSSPPPALLPSAPSKLLESELGVG